VVDDDEDLRRLLVRMLGDEEDRRVEQAGTAAEARALLAGARYDVVITDLSMPGEGGLSLMQWSQRNVPGPAWIVLTGYGTLDTAVTALKLGAFDFLEKPLRGVEAIRTSVRNAVAHQRLCAERDRLHAELEASNVRLREHVEELEAASGLLREQADVLRADLHRAGIIQRALLPSDAPRIPGFQVHALYRPSLSVGGDLYDVVALDDRHAVVLIADAAGHGLSAAMLAVLFRSQLSLVDPDRRRPRAPREVLSTVNRTLCQGLPAPGLFLTAAYCLLDGDTGVLTVASAGHPPLLVVRRGGGAEAIFHTGPALGLYPDADFSQQCVRLDPGDRLLLYSDGLYDRLAVPGQWPHDAIATRLAAGAGGGRELLRDVLGAGGGPATDEYALQDDVTLVLLDARPGESTLDNGTPQPWHADVAWEPRFEILVGTDAERTTLSIQGRATWDQSGAFHAAGAAALERGQPVMLDLALCQHLDSTFLGTVHELASLAERLGVEFRVQGATPVVERLFVELGMRLVLDRLVPRMLPLPTRMHPLVGACDPGAGARRVLHAHETLAALNDRNRREFDPLLRLLRREVDTASR
jgi:serine phosphatase RsbU (regulator of sigma subunit)/anti-anti-sigma regulatory factor